MKHSLLLHPGIWTPVISAYAYRHFETDAPCLASGLQSETGVIKTLTALDQVNF